MYLDIDHVLKFATPTGVIGTFLTLVYTIKNVRRQINAEILMKYTERCEHILDKFPQDALFGRFDSQALPPQSPQLTLCLLLRHFIRARLSATGPECATKTTEK
jgi:hypothetical protein